MVELRVVVIEIQLDLQAADAAGRAVPADAEVDGSNYGGASLEALVRLGRTKDKDYRIAGCSFARVNAFFVRADLCADHSMAPATAEKHHEPARYFHAAQSGNPPRLGPYVIM